MLRNVRPSFPEKAWLREAGRTSVLVEFVRITAAMRQRIAFGACGALLFLCLLGWMLTTPDSMPPIHFHATGEELRRCTPAVPMPNRELSLANQVVPLPDFDLMPFKHFLKSREQLEKVEWLTTLYNYLLTLNKSVSPHLNMVNGDYNHRYLMENWIVAAMMILNPPLRNVLVLSLDKELCDYIATGIHTCSLGVTCIVASVNSTFSSEAGEYWITGTMTRPVTLSLIN